MRVAHSGLVKTTPRGIGNAQDHCRLGQLFAQRCVLAPFLLVARGALPAEKIVERRGKPDQEKIAIHAEFKARCAVLMRTGMRCEGKEEQMEPGEQAGGSLQPGAAGARCRSGLEEVRDTTGPAQQPLPSWVAVHRP